MCVQRTYLAHYYSPWSSLLASFSSLMPPPSPPPLPFTSFSHFTASWRKRVHFPEMGTFLSFFSLSLSFSHFKLSLAGTLLKQHFFFFFLPFFHGLPKGTSCVSCCCCCCCCCCCRRHCCYVLLYVDVSSSSSSSSSSSRSSSTIGICYTYLL